MVPSHSHHFTRCVCHVYTAQSPPSLTRRYSCKHASSQYGQHLPPFTKPLNVSLSLLHIHELISMVFHPIKPCIKRNKAHPSALLSESNQSRRSYIMDSVLPPRHYPTSSDPMCSRHDRADRELTQRLSLQLHIISHDAHRTPIDRLGHVLHKRMCCVSSDECSTMSNVAM